MPNDLIIGSTVPEQCTRVGYILPSNLVTRDLVLAKNPTIQIKNKLFTQTRFNNLFTVESGDEVEQCGPARSKEKLIGMKLKTLGTGTPACIERVLVQDSTTVSGANGTTNHLEDYLLCRSYNRQRQNFAPFLWCTLRYTFATHWRLWEGKKVEETGPISWTLLMSGSINQTTFRFTGLPDAMLVNGVRLASGPGDAGYRSYQHQLHAGCLSPQEEWPDFDTGPFAATPPTLCNDPINGDGGNPCS